MCRRCPTPAIVHSSTCGSADAEELGRLHPYRLGVGAQHRQDGLADGGCLFAAEHPLGEGGQLDSEEGVRVLDGLGHGAWETLVEQRSA